MSTDTDVKQNVLEEFRWLPGIDAKNIDVSVEDGAVKLTGTVSTFYERNDAQRVARNIAGVKSVKNNLTVEPKAPHERSDEELKEAVERTLIWDTSVPDENIKAEVENGNVSLNGYVEWNYQRENAEDAISNLAGVKNISNNINVESSADIQNPVEQLKAAMERSSLVDADKVNIVIDGTKIKLGGTVSSDVAKSQAEKIAWSTPGVYEVENNISVAA